MLSWASLVRQDVVIQGVFGAFKLAAEMQYEETSTFIYLLFTFGQILLITAQFKLSLTLKVTTSMCPKIIVLQWA